MKKIVTTLILSIVLVVVLLNNMMIAQTSASRLSFIAVTNWPTHFEYAVLPFPWNSYVAEYYIKKKAGALIEEFEVKQGVDVGIMLYASLAEDISFDDAVRLTSVLLDAGADINYVNRHSGCTFVRNLIANEAIRAANYLLSKGADLSITDPQRKHRICSDDVASILERFPGIEMKSK